MDEKLVLSLANAGCLNSYRTENIGLISGTLGIALFLYHFNRHKGGAIYAGYADFADGLVESFWDGINKLAPLSFETGLSGLVFGVNNLIDNEFLDGDPDELFGEIDELFSTPLSSANITLDIDATVPFFSKGLYAITRNDKALAGSLFEAYCQHAPEVSLSPSLNYINSLLLFLCKLETWNQETDRNRLSQLFETINRWLENVIVSRLYDHSDLIVFKNLVEGCSSEIADLIAKESLGALNTIPVDNYADLCYNLGWKSMVFGQSHRLKDYIPEDFRIDDLFDRSPTAKIVAGLKDGLSGLGLTLIVNA
jgi:hypothetical protein